MKLLFYLVAIVEMVEIIFVTRKTRIFFSAHNVFFVTIVFNFLLYLQNWSTFFVNACADLTYFLIIASQIIVTVFDLICFRKEVKQKHKSISNRKFKVKKIVIDKISIEASTILLFICLLCSMIENFSSYGTLFPFFNDIDAHKNTTAVFGTIWRSVYPIALIFFIIENSNEKKRIHSFLFLIFVAAYMLLSGGSRFWSVLSIGSSAIFYFVFYKPKLKLKNVLFICFLMICFVAVLLKMGISRLTVMTYEEKIGYIGPFSNTAFGEVAAWYYGYFPYSFYNLNLTLQNIHENHLYTYGLFFILPVLLVTKLYKLLGIQSYDQIALSVRVITNSSATVATAFFEFYADFGYLFPISIIFYLILLESLHSSKTVFGEAGYSYFLLCWGLFNFYNVVSNGIPYTMLLLLWFLCKIFIYKESPKNRLQAFNMRPGIK